MSRLLTSAAAALALAVVLAALPPPATAHPLGNYTVNRAVAIEIGASVGVRYVVDMAEIPAFETIQRIDADGDGTVGEAEGATFARETCAASRATLAITIDGDPADLRDAAAPALDFPPGAGGLATLRLDCRFALLSVEDPGVEHDLTLRDLGDATRIGWREVTARAQGGARIVASDVPEQSASDLLTAYPEDRLEAPSDVSTGRVRFRLAPEPTDGTPTTTGATATRPPGAAPADPLATLIGGHLSPAVVALAILLSLGLGALHALSPGHGKTLVAAYVLGAGGTPRSAALIGLSVAVSHTAGVFVLGVVTLLASQFILPERLIGWLSLGSGVIVTGLGAVLLTRAILSRSGGSAYPHDGRGGHAHPHPHAHDHDHSAASRPGLSRRSALALGFAGGAVPSASAVIVLLVAIGTDRLLLGLVMIAAFGIGMACVLGGLALVMTRIGQAADGSRGWLASPVARRVAALVPAVAGVAVLLTGLAFSVAAVAQFA